MFLYGLYIYIFSCTPNVKYIHYVHQITNIIEVKLKKKNFYQNNYLDNLPQITIFFYLDKIKDDQSYFNLDKIKINNFFI